MRATIPPLMTLAAVLTLAAAAPAHAQDRYGPSTQDPVPAAASTPPRTRFLTWPGKAAPPSTAPASAAPAARAPAMVAGAPVANARPTAAPSRLAAPRYKTLADYRANPTPSPAGWRPVYPTSQATSAPTPAAPSTSTPTLAGQPQPAPSSIYAPGPPRPAAYAQSARPSGGPAATASTSATPTSAVQGDEHVRFYSLHRQYGIQPDAAPIPPQFFSSSADLSEPPGPISIQRLTSTSGSTTTTRTVRGADGSDSASASTQQ